MRRLRFINPLAQITEVTVGAVNDGEPLVFNEVYTVSDELAGELTQNDADWQQESDSKKHVKAELPVVAETEGGNE